MVDAVLDPPKPVDPPTPDPAAVAAAAKAAATPPTPVPIVVPEKYTLTPPAGVTVDPALIERTAATARTLGLSQEAGQQLFTNILNETTAREAAFVEAWQPGTGSEWKKQDTARRAQALADPEVGGTPEKLATSIELGNKFLKFLKADDIKQLLQDTGLGSDVRVIRVLARAGKAMSESSLVLSGTNDGGGETKSLAERLYGKDGTGKKPKE